ncbi:Ld-FP' [Lymantria dispar multiple nucleopolyhedrovirus]|uniref:25K FP frameshift protein n=1 Tax=Lymantria dispar multicapsid nuclear polyhedrosis virus TaxID=10449 RepID=P91749_NPVLD|nr:Ld-FP' [Lymantria dispar multiple nucleopolyhedrovirus]AAC56571.1 25K FP frameshift protein [Lymantria dispar multiple nucleopolyhedrovirus]AAC70249.1 Ld-FP' [Lymantria dispar multiple nucleopolyhedrovirus]
MDMDFDLINVSGLKKLIKTEIDRNVSESLDALAQKLQRLEKNSLNCSVEIYGLADTRPFFDRKVKNYYIKKNLRAARPQLQGGARVRNQEQLYSRALEGRGHGARLANALVPGAPQESRPRRRVRRAGQDFRGRQSRAQTAVEEDARRPAAALQVRVVVQGRRHGAPQRQQRNIHN